jgi:hypothetical protein
MIFIIHIAAGHDDRVGAITLCAGNPGLQWPVHVGVVKLTPILKELSHVNFRRRAEKPCHVSPL